MTKNKNNYKDSGVNISEGQEFVKDIKDITDKLSPSFSLGTIGSFSGYVEIPSNYENPVFALACDGVGTKMRIALRKQSLSTIGIDLVAMCVNDLIVSGAKPIAFLDYYGCSQLNRNQAKEVIEGIVEGCKISGCDLVGGETAEMPNHYKDNNFDLVGFSMGVNEKTKIIATNYKVFVGLNDPKFRALKRQVPEKYRDVSEDEFETDLFMNLAEQADGIVLKMTKG